jgi:hypothetical protein
MISLSAKLPRLRRVFLCHDDVWIRFSHLIEELLVANEVKTRIVRVGRR